MLSSGQPARGLPETQLNIAVTGRNDNSPVVINKEQTTFYVSQAAKSGWLIVSSRNIKN